MARTKISEFSATPGNNTDIDGINLAEGCAPSGINDAIRELMAQLKDFQAGTAGDSFNGPVGTTTAAAGAFTTLTTSSTVTHNGGTANGVAYLNGSKVLTTGSALTFDGTRLFVGTTAVTTSSSQSGEIYSTGATGFLFTNTTAGNYPISVKNEGASGTRNLINFFEGAAGGTPRANISFDGSNNLAITPSNALIFGASSSEQMRLTSTGLGIGTSSPATQFVVSNAGAQGVEITGSNGAIQVYNRSTSAYGTMNLYANTLYFRTGASPAINMTLDSSGNLGIGTSSPGGKLDIYQNSARYVRAYPSSGLADFEVVTNNNVQPVFAVKGTGTADLIRAYAGATQAFTLDSSGNLGLGVTPSADWASSSYKAFVVRTSFLAGSTAPGVMALGNNAYNDGAGWKYVATGVASYYVQNAGAHSWSYAPSGTAGNPITFTQAMTLDASGNLGLGNTNPASYGGFVAQLASGIALHSNSVSGAAGLNLYENGTGRFSLRTLNGSAGLSFFDTFNGVERARITSGGDVGIGTTSPTYKLAVESTGQILLSLNSTNANGGYMAIQKSGIATGYIGAANPLTGGSSTDLAIRAENNLVFATNTSTERARITSGGAWQVGTSGVYTEHATVQRAANEYTTTFVSPRATAAQNFGLQVTYSAADPNGTGNFFLYCEANGTIRANIRSNGGIANYSANNVNLSDRREKTNFAPAKSYIDAICAIPVQTFNYVDQNMEEDPGLTLGVVAQDVQAVAPELVMESNWAKEGEDPKMRLSIYQTDLQYALMKCIQEQQVMINELKAEVAALKAK